MTKKHITISSLDAEFCIRALEVQAHIADLSVKVAERYGDLACLEHNQQIKSQSEALQLHLRDKIGVDDHD